MHRTRRSRSVRVLASQAREAEARKQEADARHRERQAVRARELDKIRERGGRVVEHTLASGDTVRIVMEGESVQASWDAMMTAQTAKEKQRREQRRLEAERCYLGAVSAVGASPPAVEQAKFLFDRAREV